MNSRQWTQILYILFLFSLVLVFLIGYIFHDKYPKNALKHKGYLINNYNPKIVFSGDSRAERQLNVDESIKILKLKNGDIVNIAISFGDPIMINNLIDKYPKKFKNTILIISISANQINDNANKLGSFTKSMIAKMSYVEQLKIFIHNSPITIVQYYLYNIRYQIKLLLNIGNNINYLEASFGFDGIDKKLDIKTITIEKQIKNILYENYTDGGIKYILISKALKKLKSRVKKLYVYTAPFSPTYINIIKDSILLDNEMSFKKHIKNICISNNIKYKNYLILKDLQDKHFYDVYHLNIEGSKIFTKIVLKDFNIK